MKIMRNPTIAWKGKVNDLPKISIITPCLNHSEFIEPTLVSVLSQGYPNLEYIVLDGGSTDGSAEIIEKYSPYLAYWHTKTDSGQYHAIQEGFNLSSGEIMTWLNSDDMLHRNSLWTVAEIFTRMPQVEWLHGNPTWFDASGRTIAAGPPPQWSRYRYLLGDFKWIQQESIFWKRSLWEKSGNCMNTCYEYAADLELWMRFFRHARLFSTTAILGGFRSSSITQKGRQYRSLYLKEADEIIKSEPLTPHDVMVLSLIKRLQRLASIPIIRIFLKKKLRNQFSFPAVITFNTEYDTFSMPLEKL